VTTYFAVRLIHFKMTTNSCNEPNPGLRWAAMGPHLPAQRRFAIIIKHEEFVILNRADGAHGRPTPFRPTRGGEGITVGCL
jgi:hypothetical protein